MKGHPIATALVVFLATPALISGVAMALEPNTLTDDQKKARRTQVAAFGLTISIPATIVAYYTSKG